MAYDYESGILGAISDTAFSSKNIRRPTKKKTESKKSSAPAIVPTTKPKRTVLLSNLSNKDINSLKISNSQKDRLIRDKRAIDYAPGGKWADKGLSGWINRTMPGVNDVNSVLSDAELDEWYASRGLERGNYAKGLLGAVRKISPVANLLGFVSDALTGKKEQAVVPMLNPFMSNDNFFTKTPMDLVEEVREKQGRKAELKEKYPSLTDTQITELVEAEENIQSQQFPEIKTYGTSILPENIAQQIDEQQQMAMNPYIPTQTMARPVDLGLLSGANIGAEYTTPFSQPVDYRVDYGSLGQRYDDMVIKKAQKALEEKGYQDLGIQGVTGNPLLPSSILYQNTLFGDIPKSANITANLLAYNPQTGQEVPDWALSESQRLRKNLYAQDIINEMAKNSRVSNFNLLGY